ncbi:hypothetical protein DFH08DRAFT_797404 [Mycena albidolilacea]|uniref:DUF6532 domain-containing protein n=1 Tax=Mycena albidolilacea TaxID=1033008 RepID=A0AAD7F4G3_9AGAR|nr:hypothetical protein DFH08DRAFT_797404 [Mycena albidolilacea]
MTDLKYLTVLVDLVQHSLLSYPSFGSHFSFELIDHVNIIHDSIKKVVASLAPSLYKILGLTSEATMKLIGELLKDHHYIFGVDPHTSQIKTNELFLHAAIIAVIKQAIFTSAFKAQVKYLFILMNPDYPTALNCQMQWFVSPPPLYTQHWWSIVLLYTKTHTATT